MRQSIERYALVLAVAALVLLVAGREILRQVLWVLLFLFLLVPLPSFIHGMISPPLQTMATTGAVFLLEAFAVGVSRQGNVVILGETTPIAVAEACNGLRMLTAFAIVAAFVAYMVKRPRWQKATLLISSIPVGVMCNIIRIFVTALLMLLVSTEIGEKFFHDFAGLVMMPAAVLLIFGELWVMDKVFVPDAEPPARRCIARARSARQTPARKP
jgi:exosortase